MSQSLQSLAEDIKRYRQGGRRAKYPLSFWPSVQRLTGQYSFKEIATALSMDLGFLKRKLKELGEPVSFVPLQLQPTNSLSIRFTSSYGRKIALQCSQDDLSLLQTLLPMVAAL